jgi:hypothetical protein
MQAVTGKITEKPKPRPQSAPMKLVTSPLAVSQTNFRQLRLAFLP